MGDVEDAKAAVRDSGMLMGGIFMEERYRAFGNHNKYQRMHRTVFIKAFAEGVNKKLAEILEQEL